MKKNFIPLSERLVLAILLTIGVLILTLTMPLSKRISIPDTVKGLLMGVGIGLETVALVKMRKLKKQNGQCAS